MKFCYNTWIYPSCSGFQIDNCLTRRDHLRFFKNTQHACSANSDHWIVRSRIRPLGSRRRKKSHQQGKKDPVMLIDWKTILHESTKRTDFHEQMKAKCSSSIVNNDFYATFTSVAKQCTTQATPNVSARQDRPWFSLNKEKLLQAINKASLLCRKSPSPLNYKKFKTERSKVKRLVEDAKIMWTKNKFL